ncbi:GT2 family glycosyltransferase [Bradyrhizobium sp. F1.4.3]|uniref:glycosyltransferase n=1 Tax=Bradyrhizobium sp. F1.4.3 TaxID=3156356 RepID=UPI003398F380
MKFHELGVVVIGRNEGQRLVDCIASIQAATVGVLVYVDSGSTDRSVEVAERAGAKVVMLEPNQAFTAARARNEGFGAIRQIAPEIGFVQFVDGDCILDAGWLAKAMAFLEERAGVAVVCGRRRERYPSASIYNQLCDLEWNTPVGEASACGGDSLVRVAAFEEVGGFLSRIMAGEEPELCIRLRERGWKIWRLDAEMTLHDAAMSKLRQWWIRSIRSGYGFAEVTRLHKTSPFRIWSRAVPSALLWGATLPACILLASAFHPLFLLLFLVYPLQICSIAVRKGLRLPGTWAYAFLAVLGKFAQAWGIAKFYWGQLRGRGGQLIEYKSQPTQS